MQLPSHLSPKSKSFWISTTTAAFAMNLLSSSIAFSQKAVAAQSTVSAPSAPSALVSATTESTAQASVIGTIPASGSAAMAESKTFVAAGQPYHDEHLQISIMPPSGWEVMTHTGSLSLVMREPKSPVVYDKPMYQRNITVAAIHRSSPIDEVRAKELQAELSKTFGGDTMVSNFQILEHKFFNYRGINDGLVVYSSLNIGEFPMMQMHVLVSGQQKQFLMTYTDLADAFTDTKNPNFEQAWGSIVSIDVSGMAPDRKNELIRYGVASGSVFSFLMVLFFIRRRVSRKDFNAEADALEEGSFESGFSASSSVSMISTLHHGWRLGRKKGKEEDDQIEFSNYDLALSHGPKSTRQTEYMSSF